MNELQYFGVASGLGLGGFDPAPALIAGVYMATRSSASGFTPGKTRRDVLLFGSLLILGTALWGALLSSLFGERLAEVPWHSLLRAGAWAAGIEIALAVGGLVFAWFRWIHRADPPKDTENQNRSLAGLLVVALGFIALVTTDVPYVVMIGLSSHHPAWVVVPAFLSWAIISQVPLFILCVAVLFNRQSKVAQWIGKAWSAARRWVRTAIPLAIAVVCLLLLADAAEFFLVGRFLVG